MHLGRSAEDHRVDIVALERFGQLGAGMLGAVLGGDFGGLFGAAGDDRDDLDPVDVLEAVEMLFTEGTGAGEGNAHGGAPKLQSPPASERGSSGCVRRVVQSPPRAPPASGRGGRSGRSAEAVAAHDLARLERLTGGFLWLEDQRAERGVRGGDV